MSLLISCFYGPAGSIHNVCIVLIIVIGEIIAYRNLPTHGQL